MRTEGKDLAARRWHRSCHRSFAAKEVGSTTVEKEKAQQKLGFFFYL
jgi:hypothetical protein